ncbi:hypothetical protein EVAR_49946_1 [Eumeta japonica]|uniref:Uncharacterized protein n=1 Tax=Eumeta variegata TaxID=151549 RepID=A0A4C1XSU5_EUMVA|nr:hypothetical protein EVAR_49946_1 [Eumeta japonica]
MATTEGNINAVWPMIEIDKRDLPANSDKLRHRYESNRQNPTRTLSGQEALYWWIPHNLTEAQKLSRINWCHEMMQRFAGDDSNAVYVIVTELRHDRGTCELHDQTLHRHAIVYLARRSDVKMQLPAAASVGRVTQQSGGGDT